MSRTLQFKRFANTAVANTTGAQGELIIDNTNNTITVHDGVTVGGTRLATENFASSQSGQSVAAIAILQGVNLTQNTNIQSAWNTANTANIAAAAAYNQANTSVQNTSTIIINNLSPTGNLLLGIPIGVSASIPTVASALTIAPSTPILFISGTTAIQTITPPPGFTFGGQITVIPTGLFTTTTAGNIALATTAVVNKSLILTYSATTSKWYPSY